MFTVPLIPPDLRHEETIIQAAYALDCLQTTINTIFGRIDERIQTNNDKVGQLQERLKKSQEKIKSLQGTRKAIHIYAPARFPSNNVFKEIPATFVSEKRFDKTQQPAKVSVQSKVDPNLPNINEKLVFFHVRDHQQAGVESAVAKERKEIKQQDLGDMPSELRSVSSVLLFNSDCSPYNLNKNEDQHGNQTENWKRAFKSKRNNKNASISQTMTPKQILEPAPHSLAHRNEKLTPSGGLKYTPKLSEAPELNLPWDLPELQGIADDMRYDSQEAKQKIAPSMEMIVESLPDLNDLIKESLSADVPNERNKADNNSKENVSTPPPPPPPPQPVTLMPPPPPPPPTLQPTPKVTAAKSLPAADNRSELMAAIRNAGGANKARLKKSAAAPLTANNNETTQTESNSQQRKPAATGGNLMADLHNKLLMRRKGISGAKDAESAEKNMPSGNPVISRLSSLIPPPPTKAKTTSDEEDSNDNDWVD